MPFYVINNTNSITNTTNGGTALTLAAGDNVIVQATGSLLATGTSSTGIFVGASADEATVVVNGLVYGMFDGIHSLGDFAQITVTGQVVGSSTGIRVGNGGYVYVASGGLVTGSEGLAMSDSTLINDGTVNGIGNQAIQISSGWLINNGLISSRIEGIFYTGGGAASIENTGTIQGGLITHFSATAETAQLTVKNSGDWIGSLGLTPGNDSVINTGTIEGGVNLGHGANLLDSRHGLITGDVSAGSGVDSILLGAGDTLISGGGGGDTIDGGAGYDTVTYQTSMAGVSVNLLTGTAAGGDAQGDRLSGIEALYGSLNRDTLIGDDGNNILNGLLGRDTLTGNGGNDTIILLGTGTATIDAGSGNDLIQLTTFDPVAYNYAFRSVMQVNGGSGYDTLEVTRCPNMTFTNTTVRNIERLLVGDGFHYNFTAAAATVATGARLAVDGGSLTGTNRIIFDGSIETGGAFDFTGGTGADTFIGGTGADTFTGGGRGDAMTGGGGADTFIFNGAADSKFTARDVISDFATASDTFQFDVEVTGVEAQISGSVSTGADLNALASSLDAGHAVLVNVTGGTLAGRTLLLVDANGNDGFQAATDYCIDVTGIVGTLTVADFII